MAYTPRILTDSGDMQGVRFAADMNDTELSDARILSQVYLPAVESNVIKIVPTYASLSGDDLNLIRSAVTNFVAARAVSRKMEKERAMEYAYTRQRQSLVDNLLKQGMDDLESITVVSAQIVPNDIFDTYGPTKYRVEQGEWIDVSGVIKS